MVNVCVSSPPTSPSFRGERPFPAPAPTTTRPRRLTLAPSCPTVRSPLARPEEPEQPGERVVELVHHPFLEGDDGVVRDGDVLRAHPGTTLGDVAVADALIVFQVLEPVLGVQRV